MRFRAMNYYLSELSNDFDTFLRVEKNLSSKTRNAYKYDLKRFHAFLIKEFDREPPIDKIIDTDIKKYLNQQQLEKNLKSTTLSRMISSIRIFFDFCVEHKCLTNSPAQYIRSPKHTKRLPIYLIESELKKLLSTPDKKDFLGLRDYTILITLVFTGMRLQEIVNINIEDIDFERNTIKVMGKGSKERLIPINRILLNALKDYFEKRPITEDKSVFLNRRGKRISGRQIERIVKHYALKAQLTKTKITPHKLRHTFATLLHLSEVDLIEIQSLLGHSSITSTQIYTHTNPKKLKTAVEKLEDI
jgi:site-specific recombinase XerD